MIHGYKLTFDAVEIERRFRCGYYTFEQIIKTYGLTRAEAMKIIKPALNDGNYANFDPRYLTENAQTHSDNPSPKV